MCKEIKGNQRHLNLNQRVTIQSQLDQGMCFKDIAKLLSKDPTTISKEVKNRRIVKESTTMKMYKKGCIHKKNCKRTNVCNHTPQCYKRCVNCEICTEYCKDFQTKTCNKFNKPPYVCNACESRAYCRLEKMFYNAGMAQKEYEKTLRESRQGIDISVDQMEVVDKMITPLIKNGQSITHIYSSHSWEIPFSPRTLYNYIDQGLLGARNIDLHRKVRFRPRKKYKPAMREHEFLEGRKYKDFLEFTQQNPSIPIVEMDTVEGRKGGKVLLTMYFRDSKLLLGFLLENETQGAVLQVFDRLEKELTTGVFKETFPLILTDNGSEFLNPFILEDGINGEKRTRIFYCDPYSSYQKGGIEKAHEYVRYVIPKGTSMDHLEQEDITLMINNINSAARKSLKELTPHQASSLQERVFKVLSLELIPPDLVHLKPSLLKK